MKRLPESCAITDCKSLHDALEKNESLGLGLSEKRTSIEVTATRQQMRATGIKTRWANSDRQLADVLTKPTASPISIQQLQRTGKWKIVWDANYTSAKNIRKAQRDQHFKTNQTVGSSFASRDKETPSKKHAAQSTKSLSRGAEPLAQPATRSQEWRGRHYKDLLRATPQTSTR